VEGSVEVGREIVMGYDAFAEKWHERRRGGNSHSKELIEKPCVFELAGDIRDLDVLFLGCGSGEECAFVKEKGARKVYGFDNSHKLIELAEENYKECEFAVEDLKSFAVRKESFDIAIASLSLHYIESWQETFLRVYTSLRPGGTFIFSINHPARFGAEIIRGSDYSSFLGYTKTKEGTKVYGDYLNKRKINDVWFGELEVEFYHWNIEDVMKEVLQSKFTFIDLKEPKPIERAKKEDVDFYTIHSRIPQFLVVKLEKQNK